MDVVKAIAQGRCALAVSGALLRDPEVMLALTNRGALNPMALSGPAVSPVQPIGELGAARALAQQGGVIVLVEPERGDQQGLENLGKLLKRSTHKPKIMVVSRSYNPFAFGSALAGLQIEHSKGRGKAFITGLPTPPADLEVPEIPVTAKVKKKSDAPRFVFAGREEEVASLAAVLGEGGPLVVSGPSGVGRTQLVEHALVEAGLKAFPDLTLGWDVGFDTLIGRLAEICAQAGQSALKDALRDPAKGPAELVKTALETLQASELGDRVMVVQDLEFALGPESDFFRRSRVELLVEALLTHTYSLRLVFVSARQPMFYREGQAAALRRVEVAGLKGRFLHEIFEAYKAPEFPRDRFGNIAERTFGHPMAAKLFALALRDQEDPAKLLDNEKFFKLRNLGDVKGLAKRVEKAVSRLPKDLRAQVSALSHTRLAFDGSAMGDLRISKKHRVALLSTGLLDVVGPNENKRYRIHSVVRSALTWRETHDFGMAEELAEILLGMAKKATDPVEALALNQEVNRLLHAARRSGNLVSLPFPDNDAVLESCIGLVRGKQPRFDMARDRLRSVVKGQPANSDAWLLGAELERKAESKGDEILTIFDKAVASAAVPEVFHRSAGYWLGRRKRPKAIEVLEQGVAALPEEPRLHTRLASLLLRQGRRPEGLEHLQKAMELAPMLPDAYGLMGQARRAEGQVDEAETLLREAARLGGDDPVQIARLVDLLLARARVDLARQDSLRTEAREFLDEILTGDRSAPDANLLLATLVRETTGDIERAAWLLKQARKETERGTDRHRRIQIEGALHAMAAGRLDEAENNLRERCGRDPSDHRTFAALAHVLEAREMFVPAHAEYLRAMERAPKGSLSAQLYEMHLARMQAVIEAQAAGLFNPPPAAAEPAPMGPSGHQRVIRRKKADGSESAAGAPAAEAVADASAAPEEAAAAAEEPAAAEPAVEEPAVEEPPAAAEPAVEEPAAAEPAVEESVAAAEEPVVEEPAVAEPASAAEPVVAEPAAAEPAVETDSEKPEES